MIEVFEKLTPIVILFLLLFQVIIPVIQDKPMFFWFIPKKKSTSSDKVPSTLTDEINTVKTEADEVKAKAKMVLEKAEGNLKSAEDLKKAADKII